MTLACSANRYGSARSRALILPGEYAYLLPVAFRFRRQSFRLHF